METKSLSTYVIISLLLSVSSGILYLQTFTNIRYYFFTVTKKNGNL